MPKYIIFDFDGTIADTYQIIKNIISNFDKGKEINFDEIRDRGIEYLFKKINIPFWKSPKVIHEILSQVRKQADVKLFPEMPEMLEKLNKNYKLGIVSSNSEKNIRKVLKKYKIEDLFKFIYADNPLFGKHIVLKRMCKRYSLKVGDLIYVGDEDRDITAAKKIKIKIIAVTWGFNSKNRLVKKEPDYIVNSIMEIPEIISTLATIPS